tara:strand:+ start:90 stop:260 length:171 start_codon:yes stop_codon:yes gene_type:complete
MTTRKEIITALDLIELQLKSFKVDCDNNGNFNITDLHSNLIKREDELMQELQKFPL